LSQQVGPPGRYDLLDYNAFYQFPAGFPGVVGAPIFYLFAYLREEPKKIKNENSRNLLLYQTIFGARVLFLVQVGLAEHELPPFFFLCLVLLPGPPLAHYFFFELQVVHGLDAVFVLAEVCEEDPSVGL
jgi:hypothetical protein